MVLVGVVILRDCSALLLLSLAAPSMQVRELWLQTTTKRETSTDGCTHKIDRV